MGLILLEALLALAFLVAIVWWTMFSGRRRGELIPKDDAGQADAPPPHGPPPPQFPPDGHTTRRGPTDGPGPGA